MDVFVSYSTKNKSVADQIVTALEDGGITCWYAPRNIKPGQEWVSAINEAIEEAKIFLLLYTDESNASRQVANEVALAFNAGKKMIPFRLSEAPMSNEIRYYLTRVHWLDAVGKPLEQSITALCEHAAGILREEVSDLESLPENGAGRQNKASGNGAGVSGVSQSKSGASRNQWIFVGIAATIVFFLLGGVLLWQGTKEKDDGTVLSDGTVSRKDDGAFLLWEEGRVAEAKEAFGTSAEQGNSLSKLALLTIQLHEMLDGRGKKGDENKQLEESRKLFEEAQELVNAGLAEANYLLGAYHAEGLGGMKNKDEAIRYFELAVEGKEKEWVTWSYGYLCLTYASQTEGGSANLKKVEEYANAVQGLQAEVPIASPLACDNVAEAYRSTGESEKALIWYKLAAGGGMASAMNQLGLAYLNGDGTEEDLALAEEWFEKAADAGDENAKKNLEYLRNSK